MVAIMIMFGFLRKFHITMIIRPHNYSTKCVQWRIQRGRNRRAPLKLDKLCFLKSIFIRIKYTAQIAPENIKTTLELQDT